MTADTQVDAVLIGCIICRGKVNIGNFTVRAADKGQTPIARVDNTQIFDGKAAHAAQIYKRIVEDMRTTVLIRGLFGQTVVDAAVQKSAVLSDDMNVTEHIFDFHRYADRNLRCKDVGIHTVRKTQMRTVENHRFSACQKQRGRYDPYVISRQGIGLRDDSGICAVDEIL